MDYDADGDLDVITGSYTGQLYLFRRGADGALAQRELFTVEGGDTLMMPFDTAYSITPELVDMDADGDLDLVIGTRTGAVQIVDNIGTRSEPVWSKEHRDLLTKDGDKIEGSNAHHADWNGDGRADLIVGSEHGDVFVYRNVGRKNKPSYAKAERLLMSADYRRDPEGSTPQHHGMRVKVHVTDWNGDGKQDLLVGDVIWQEVKRKPLTADEEKAKAKLEQQVAYYEQAAQSFSEGTKQRERHLRSAAELKKQLRTYRRSKSKTHGWVWLYLRK